MPEPRRVVRVVGTRRPARRVEQARDVRRGATCDHCRRIDSRHGVADRAALSPPAGSGDDDLVEHRRADDWIANSAVAVASAVRTALSPHGVADAPRGDGARPTGTFADPIPAVGAVVALSCVPSISTEAPATGVAIARRSLGRRPCLSAPARRSRDSANMDARIEFPATTAGADRRLSSSETPVVGERRCFEICRMGRVVRRARRVARARARCRTPAGRAHGADTSAGASRLRPIVFNTRSAADATNRTASPDSRARGTGVPRRGARGDREYAHCAEA